MKSSDERVGKQQGDPVRGCEAIITAVESNTPHLRLLLGEMAYTLELKKQRHLKIILPHGRLII